MKKTEFLAALKKQLSRMPEEDLLRTLDYYSEMIDDRMEEGLSEEAAVADVGNLEEIVAQILPDAPKKRKKSTAEILLLVLGFPVWFPILVSIAAVAISVIVSVYAVAVALAACGVGGVVGGVLSLILQGDLYANLFLLGAGLTCGGLAIFVFPLATLTVKGCIALVKTICRKEK